MKKQAYKLKLPKKWRIHPVFYVSLLEQDITRKNQVEEIQLELDAGNSKEYNVKTIWDSTIYTRELKGHLPELYYLVLWKNFLEKENT